MSYIVVSQSPLKVIKDGRIYQEGKALAIILQDIAEQERTKVAENVTLRDMLETEQFNRQREAFLLAIPDEDREEVDSPDDNNPQNSL